jgi:glycosyltransferase involved in cell wall biosynthesis
MAMSKNKLSIYIDGEVLVLPHFSGIGHYTLEMVKAIDSIAGIDSSLKVTLGVHWRLREKAESFGLKNIRIVPTPFSHRIANALKIRGRQPYLDIFFGKKIYLFPNFSSWPLLYSKSVPIIYDLSYELYPQFAEPRNQAFLSTQVRLASKRASMIATISENSRQEIAKFYNYPLDKIGVYYPAVDANLFQKKSTGEINAVKAKHGVEGKYILFVGNIEPRKNLKNILLAYEKLPKKLRHEYALLLIGAKGWNDEEITTIAERLRAQGNAIVQPKQYVTDEELPAFYSGATVFVYPSIYEGFGIPPLEAMACGTPTIVSNNSSLPEATGNATFAVDALSVSSLAKALQTVLESPAEQKRLTALGIQQVKLFSWEQSAHKLIDDLRKL